AAAAALLCIAASAYAQQAPIPDVPTLMQQVQDHQRKMDETRENYTFRETIVTREFNKDGSLKKTESEENEVFYVNTHEIDRKVKKDGKDLSADEQKKEQDHVMKEVEKAQKTPAGQ